MHSHFIHAADIHLGHQQYNLTERSNDFARAYLALVEYTIAARADFLLIAGDLFHHARADAWTLKQAMHGLELLRDAGIPVVAIEGNHDAQHHYQNLSWMEFLCDAELLVLLNAQRAPNGFLALDAFDPETRRGAWIDIHGVRIYGIKYHGAALARILEGIEGQVEPGPNGYAIMMLHAGMAGQVPHMHGGLSPGQLEPLQPAINYVALGHVHKRLMESNWIFNPGSTETNSMDEMEWQHGFFEVEVDTERPDRHRVRAIEIDSRRPFHRITVTASGNETLEEFVDLAHARIERASGVKAGAVVELSLNGAVAFRPQDLPVEELKAAIETRFRPLVVRVGHNLVPPGVITVRNRERLSRADLERDVVEKLVYQQAEYRDRAPEWSRLVLDIKHMAGEDTPPAAVVDHLRAELRRLDGPKDGAVTPEDRAAEVEPPTLVDMVAESG